MNNDDSWNVLYINLFQVALTMIGINAKTVDKKQPTDTGEAVYESYSKFKISSTFTFISLVYKLRRSVSYFMHIKGFYINVGWLIMSMLQFKQEKGLCTNKIIRFTCHLTCTHNFEFV